MSVPDGCEAELRSRDEVLLFLADRSGAEWCAANGSRAGQIGAELSGAKLSVVGFRRFGVVSRRTQSKVEENGAEHGSRVTLVVSSRPTLSSAKPVAKQHLDVVLTSSY